MKIRLKILFFTFLLFFLQTGFLHESPSPITKVQVALVLDFSKSAEKTLEALSKNYWEIFNDFHADLPNVRLEVALVGYSKQSFGKKSHYVKLISNFNDAPDHAFEFLATTEIGSSVSENHVGEALQLALSKLKWDKTSNVKKQIIAIGNGPINGSYALAKKVTKKAVNKNIQLNCLYVTYKKDDKNHGYWLKLAEMSGGVLKNMVPNYLNGSGSDFLTAVNDRKIIEENLYIKESYVPFGDIGIYQMANLRLIEERCEELGDRTLASRIEFKCSPYYQGKQNNWDLVERCVLLDEIGEPLRAKGVPVEMSELTDVELETALTVKWIERNGSASIVKSLAKANRKTLSEFPKQPLYKNDLGKTILAVIKKSGVQLH